MAEMSIKIMNDSVFGRRTNRTGCERGLWCYATRTPRRWQHRHLHSRPTRESARSIKASATYPTWTRCTRPANIDAKKQKNGNFENWDIRADIGEKRGFMVNCEFLFFVKSNYNDVRVLYLNIYSMNIEIKKTFDITYKKILIPSISRILDHVMYAYDFIRG